MNFLHSITFRVTLWYLAILTVMLALLGCGVYFTLSSRLNNNLDSSLRGRAGQLSGFKDIISIIAGGTFEDQAGEYISFYYYSEDRLQNVAPRGRVFPVPTSLIDRALSGEKIFETIEMPNNGLFRVYISPYTQDNPVIRPDRFTENKQAPDRGQKREKGIEYPPRSNDRPDPPPESNPGPNEPFDRKIEIQSAALVIARPIGDIESTLRQLLHILSLAIPLTLLLSGGGGIFLAHRALRPVGRITATARQIEEGDLSRRIEVRTRDELGYLAETLNQMIARLEKAFQRQKEFTSDASHELRAPLAVIQAEATLSLRKEREVHEYRKSLEAISGEAANMANLTNQLLELARADSGKRAYQFETIDLNDFVQHICSDMAILCREKGLEFQLNVSGRIQVRGDRKSLRRLLVNILNNAVKYTEQGGTVGFLLQEKNGMAEILVSDTGIGIPKDCLPHIFERFYRVDKARSRNEGGTGLGLAICKNIANIHQGRIEVDSRVGKGSTFTIKIPIISMPLTGQC